MIGDSYEHSAILIARLLCLLLAVVDAATVPKGSSFDYEIYNSFAAIKAELGRYASQFPDLAEIQVMNHTASDNELLYLKLGRKSSKAKPFIWIDAGIHAREWISVACAMYLIKAMAKYPRLFETVDWYFMPVVNPDGYEYSRTVKRSWRKNRSGCRNDRDIKCGVDLNRNFDFDWDSQNQHNWVWSENFRGTEPASETETVTVQNALLKLAKTTSNSVYITLHSAGQFWLYPFGNKDTPDKPQNYEELKNLADRAVYRIWKSSNHTYNFTAGHAGELLYPSSGGSEDWAKDKAGIRYSYCVELPPSHDSGISRRYILPESEIKNVGHAISAAVYLIYTEISASEEASNEKGIVFPGQFS